MNANSWCFSLEMDEGDSQGRKQVAKFGGAWKDENSNFKGEIFHSTSKSTVPTKLIFLNSPNTIVLFSL